METNKQKAELWWNTTVPESEIVEWKLSMVNKYYGNRPLARITPEMKVNMWLSENKKEGDNKLYKWHDANFPPIDLNANVSEVVKIISDNKRLANRVKELEGQIEELKRTNIMTATMALEFGYTQCEKGNNIQMAFINFKKLSQ